MRVAREETQLDSLERWWWEQEMRILLSCNTLTNSSITWVVGWVAVLF